MFEYDVTTVLLPFLTICVNCNNIVAKMKQGFINLIVLKNQYKVGMRDVKSLAQLTIAIYLSAKTNVKTFALFSHYY